jgi:hypothetical protein
MKIFGSGKNINGRWHKKSPKVGMPTINKASATIINKAGINESVILNLLHCKNY